MAAKKYLDWAGLLAYNAKVAEKIAAATPITDDGTIVITADTNGGGLKLKANIDGTSIKKNGSNQLYVDFTTNAYSLISVTPSGNDASNVKEEYALALNNTEIAGGQHIKVYKDSSLLSVSLLHADLNATPAALKPTYSSGTWTDIVSASQTEANLALCFAYQLADGSVSVEAIPVGDFLRDTEFAKGIVWNSETGKAEGVVDPTSESFLTVGADGFKLAGVQTAINNAGAGAKTTITENTVALGGSGINISKSEESDGHYNYTITPVDLASGTNLTAESNRAKSAETAIDGALGLTKGANDETRTWTNTTNYKDTTNVDALHNMQAIDTQLKSVSDLVGDGFTPITYNDENNTTYGGTAGVTTGGEIDSLFA